MASVKEKAAEWGCSESAVRGYCRSGLIPPAEQEGGHKKWSIPDNWPKPPLSQHGLCFLLDTVDQLAQGVTYQAIEWGYSEATVIEGFNYLVRAGFLSTIDVTKLENELETARITSRGRKLIDADNNKSIATHTKHANVKLNLGVVSSEIGGEVSHG